MQFKFLFTYSDINYNIYEFYLNILMNIKTKKLQKYCENTTFK